MRQRTVLALAKLAENCFAYTQNMGPRQDSVYFVRTDWFADFLFETEFNSDLVTWARGLPPRTHDAIKNFVIFLWDTWAPNPSTREQTFIKLAAAVLEYSERPREDIYVFVDKRARKALLAQLELDGYQRQDKQLVRLEENVFDVAEQEGVLLDLYRSLALPEADQIARDLKDADEHYVNGKWGDCIKHARDVFEVTLKQIALALASSGAGSLTPQQAGQPRLVRQYLRDVGLIVEKELTFITALYGLLSEQGGHANMSEQEHARICRQYALSATHFALLVYAKRLGR